MKTHIDHQANLPTFHNIDPATIEQDLKSLLQQNQKTIEDLLQQKAPFTWENLMYPLEELEDALERFWSRIGHLNAVKDSPELRETYNACLPALSEYSTLLSHNKALFEAVQSVLEGEASATLSKTQKKVLSNAIRDFKLSGVALSAEDKKQFAAQTKQLSQLTTQFEQNILDATQAWTLLITEEAALAGLPDHAISVARSAAEKQKKTGWLLTLEMPCYLAVMTYADSRDLRETLYTAYVTRASEVGPHKGQWDNNPVMQSILSLRLSLAKLLGFKNAAEESLATKMVQSPDQVIAFLEQLADASLGRAREEYQALEVFAKENLNLEELKPWDLAYASEKLRQHQYAISQEDLRPYFPEPAVMSGLFEVIHRLFDITVKPVEEADVWHPDARCFALYDHDGKLRSYCYVDLYARSHKRGGAWMDSAQTRRRLKDGRTQLPIAFVTCNFNGPVGDQPALWSHDDVVTLFHEFGHALQHMLTTVDCLDVSGIHGVPWDAVELASQFLENWAWQKESLSFITKHHETGEALPETLFNKMQRAKNFQSAMQMMRQLEFSLFDFILHMEFDPQKKNQVQSILNEVRSRVSVLLPPEFNRFQCGFAHIFSGGYSAGYYSYKWAEVMASDAFSLFKERGIFDKTTAKQFLNCILETGGSEEPAVLFKRFRGRDPEVDALLKQDGIIK